MNSDQFIRDNTELLAPPLVPEIKLHLASEVLPLWHKTEEELVRIGVPPPYGPMDFAGWFEAYLGGQWYTFDARNNIPRVGRVLLARVGLAEKADAYPAQLQAALRKRGYDVAVANEGVNGDTIAGALRRFDQAIAPGTNIAIIEVGTNDLLEHFDRLDDDERANAVGDVTSLRE